MTTTEFSVVVSDFVDSVEFVQLAPGLFRSDDFVCHHNSYLAHRFMRRRGHARLQWVNGVYRTAISTKIVRHSWLSLSVDERSAIVFDIHPHSLRTEGCYLDDLMPGSASDRGLSLAVIFDPALVDVPDDVKARPWIVASRAVLERYQPEPKAAPRLDFERLDAIDAYVQADYEHGRHLGEEG